MPSIIKPSNVSAGVTGAIRSVSMKAAALLAASVFAAMIVCSLPGLGSNAFATPEAEADVVPDVAEVVASDGTIQGYSTLKEAVEAAPSGATVNILVDQTLSAYAYNGTEISLLIDKSVTLNGQGHTLEVASNGIYIAGSADAASAYGITLKNLTVVNSSAQGCDVLLSDGYKKLVFDDVDMSATGTGTTQVLTVGGNTPDATDISLNACSLSASSEGYGIIAFNPVNLNINDASISGYGCIYLKGPDNSAGASGSTVNVAAGSSLTSNGVSGTDKAFGAIVLEDTDDTAVNITDSDVNVTSGSSTPQYAVMFSSAKGADGTVSSNNRIRFSGQAAVAATGARSYLIAGNGTTNSVDVTGGTYRLGGGVFSSAGSTEGVTLKVSGGTWSIDPDAYAMAGYGSELQPDGTYLVKVRAGGGEGQGTGGSGESGGDDTGLPKVDGTGSKSPAGGGSPTMISSPTADGPHVGGQNALQQTGDTSVNPLVALITLVASVMLLALALSLRQSTLRKSAE